MYGSGVRLSLMAVLFSLLAVALPGAQAGELEDAIDAKDVARVKALLASGADANETSLMGTPLNVAASVGSVEIATVLIDAGASIELPGALGRHPLHSAAAGGKTAVARLLLQQGAMVDSLDKSGATPLIAASVVAGSFDNTEMVKMLLAAGADPRHEENTYHMTALHFAGAKGSVEVVELLVNAGLDVNLQDGNGNTVLHHAIADGRLAVVEFLLAHGADVTIANKAGETPLRLARDSPKIESLLREAGAKM